MKIITFILSILAVAGTASAQIKGCTADVRTGVCNKVCSVSHIEGCTAGQMVPLLEIHHSDCMSKAANTEFNRIDKGGPDKGEFEKSKSACSAELNKAMDDWKAAQKKKAQKKAAVPEKQSSER